MSYRLESALLAHGKPSDLKIVCERKVFDVHQGILLPSCRPIAAAFEHGTKEQQEGVIPHDVFDVDTVERWLDYRYIGEYGITDTAESQSTDSNEQADLVLHPKVLHDALVAHTRVYGIADYYEIDGLKALAYERFVDCVSSSWHNKDIPGLLDVIWEVCRYSRPKDSLREVLHDILHQHFLRLASQPEFIEGLGVLDNCHDFVADMLPRLADTIRSHRSTIQNQKNTIESLRAGLRTVEVRLEPTLDIVRDTLGRPRVQQEEVRAGDDGNPGTVRLAGEMWPHMDLFDSLPRRPGSRPPAATSLDNMGSLGERMSRFYMPGGGRHGSI